MVFCNPQSYFKPQTHLKTQVPREARDYVLLCHIAISADISCSGTKCFPGKGFVVNIQMFNLPKNN